MVPLHVTKMVSRARRRQGHAHVFGTTRILPEIRSYTILMSISSSSFLFFKYISPVPKLICCPGLDRRSKFLQVILIPMTGLPFCLNHHIAHMPSHSSRASLRKLACLRKNLKTDQKKDSKAYQGQQTYFGKTGPTWPTSKKKSMT